MRPKVWQPPVEPSPAEAQVVRGIKRAKLFVFLRQWRHVLFDTTFQQELAALYADSPTGQPPLPPAQLALATIVQAYTGVSDDEVLEATVMDRRWQLVLDCWDAATAPFSKGTLVAFRQRLIAADFDRRLIERTIEVAREQGGIGSRQLRAALDSSPLWGAGRVEDTYNLLGHALHQVVGVLARQQGRELTAMAEELGVGLLTGSSLKAALDLNWDAPAAREQGLAIILQAVRTLEQALAERTRTAGPVATATRHLAVAQQVRDQDVVVGADGIAQLRQGVAKDRRISIEDGEMRHGRKSHSQRIDGFKRHILRDLDTGLVRAVGLTPANAPEASVTPDLQHDLAAQAVTLTELHLDRAYLSSALVRDRPAALQVFCRAWPVRNGDRFPKTAFTLDWSAQTLTCPNQVTLPFTPGQTVHFPATTCAACPQRVQCTTSRTGRRVAIHPDERLLAELRERVQTPAGRAKLRERVPVEHSLAHIGRWQGRRARYLGLRKNLFDLRRCAVVHNLHVLAPLPPFAPAA